MPSKISFSKEAPSELPAEDPRCNIFLFPSPPRLILKWMKKGARTIRQTIKDLFIATRPWSFVMSLISVSVGTLLAAEEAPIQGGWFALVCIGIVCFHATANIYNDYFDTRYHVDQADSPTARYRPQPLLTGMFTPRQLLTEALVLNLLTVAIGLTLAFQRSMLIFWIGVSGLLASVFYTAGPLKLKYKAWGEFLVFLMWGPLMFEGAYAVQARALSLKAFFVSVPFGILVALVLLANNMRDIAYDSRQGIKTVGILLGSRRSFILYAGLILAAYLSVLGMVLLAILSPWGLLVFLSLPKALHLLRSFMQRIPEAADAITAQLDTLFGILLIASLIMSRTVPL
jgi:1,4-dihydroxy-2-naphthoate octaprenyltransferase